MTLDSRGGFDIDFALTTQDGDRVTIESYAGKVLLVYFGFTNCRSVCPRNLAKLTDAIGSLEVDRTDLEPLLITVDPERDSPEVLREFTSRRFPLFTGLTGTSEELADAKHAFKAFSRPRLAVGGEGGYQVAHSSFAYVVGRAGRMVDHFGDSVAAPVIADELSKHLAEE